MGCEIKITIEEDGKVIFSGTLGKGDRWTPLEAAFVVRAMASTMKGSIDGLVVDSAIARCVGIVGTVEEAAKRMGMSTNGLYSMMAREIKKSLLNGG